MSLCEQYRCPAVGSSILAPGHMLRPGARHWTHGGQTHQWVNVCVNVWRRSNCKLKSAFKTHIIFVRGLWLCKWELLTIKKIQYIRVGNYDMTNVRKDILICCWRDLILNNLWFYFYNKHRQTTLWGWTKKSSRNVMKRSFIAHNPDLHQFRCSLSHKKTQLITAAEILHNFLWIKAFAVCLRVLCQCQDWFSWMLEH